MTVVGAGEWAERARALKEEGWQVLDLCGLDGLGLTRNFPGAQPSAQHPDRAMDVPQASAARFQIVLQLLRNETKERKTVHVLSEGDPPTMPSVASLWPTVNFMEREAYDMFGIHFQGHPDLKRILMPDEWEGHPLRKDYGVGKVPVDFVPQPLLQVQTPGQGTDAAAARVDVDRLGQVKRDGEEPG